MNDSKLLHAYMNKFVSYSSLNINQSSGLIDFSPPLLPTTTCPFNYSNDVKEIAKAPTIHDNTIFYSTSGRARVRRLGGCKEGVCKFFLKR